MEEVNISNNGNRATPLENSLNTRSINEKLKSGIYSLSSKRGRSKGWEVFGIIKDNEGVELLDKVGCKTCYAVLKYDKRSNSNLVRHKCYVTHNGKDVAQIEVNSDEKKGVLRVFCQWFIENCRPFEIAHDSGLKRFSEFLVQLGAKYGAHVNIEKLLPHPTTISRNLSHLFDATFAKVKNEISVNCKYGFGLTSDMWTDNYLRQSYISLTIHYNNDGQIISRVLGLISMDGERSTGVIIKVKIQRLLHDFNCSLEDAIMVTDRGANMLSAFREFNQVYCINHLLNNVVEKSVKNVEEVAELCNLCSKIVRYFKKSGQNSNLRSTLKSFCQTRWNTIYYLLESIEMNWLEIGNILQQKKELQKIENINISYIRGVINVLKPFEEASKQLEGEKYATLHLVHAYVNGLKNLCMVEDDDIDVIKRLKEALSEHINSVIITNLSITHRLALFLFPPANKLIHFNEEEKSIVKSECARQLKLYFNNNANEENEVPLPQGQSFISSYFTNLVTPSTNNNTETKIADEIQSYELLNIPFEENFDPTRWWHLRQSQFPLLFKLSSKILSTPASSASSERVFSVARHILSEKRTNIAYNSNTFNQIVFLHFNAEKTFISNENNYNVYN